MYLLKFGMKKTIFLTFLLFGFVLNSIYCQTKLNFDGKRGDKFEALNGSIDSLRNNGSTKIILSGKTKYTDYKIFSHKRDT